MDFYLPKDWIAIRLQTVLKLSSGRDLTQEEYSNDIIGIPYITGASNFNKESISTNRYTKYPQVVVNEGDLLITCKGTIGEIAYCPYKEAHIARQIMAIKNIFNLNSKYITICIKYYLSKIKSSAKGLIPGIAREDLLNLIIPLPSMKEQLRIVKKVEEYDSYLETLNENKQDLLESINSLKSKILELAIRGKLVPQDPNDEPAEVLLERIRKEKEELIKQGKIKRDKKESIIFKGDDNSYYEKIDNSSICIDDELPFEKPENWVYVRLEDIVSYEQPTPYIVTSTNYSKKYKTPVLTAGKSFIIGYTNEDFGIRKKLPAIIFDDFTTDLRLINFPFKVKSSAMKILSVDEDLMSYDYAYYTMKCVDCDHYNHKRYWISDFSKKIITLPPKEEQERILKRINDVFKFLELIEKSLS